MGIRRGAARLLLDECANRPFKGSILQFGRQNILFSARALESWSRLHRVELHTDPEIIRRNKTTPLKPGETGNNLDDGSFFSQLGFDLVHSCDAASDENPTHVLDLNQPVPEELHEKYDVIYDGGTMEHVFNVPNVLKNIFHFLKPGGRIIHASPSNNFVDHGFYAFSPTLFGDYYLTNGYTILDFKLIEFNRSPDKGPYKVYDYTPGCLRGLSTKSFSGRNKLSVFFVARKESASSCDETPQQSIYLSRWKDPRFTEGHNAVSKRDNRSVSENRYRRKWWGGRSSKLITPVVAEY